MLVRLIFCGFTVVFLTCCKHEERSCDSNDPLHSLPCPVSMYEVIANPERYDGNFIQVHGFFVRSKRNVLFSDRDSMEYSWIINSIDVIDSDGALAGVKSGPVSIDGILEVKATVGSNAGIGSDAVLPYGVIHAIRGTSGDRRRAYSCGTDESDFGYVRDLIGESSCGPGGR